MNTTKKNQKKTITIRFHAPLQYNRSTSYKNKHIKTTNGRQTKTKRLMCSSMLCCAVLDDVRLRLGSLCVIIVLFAVEIINNKWVFSSTHDRMFNQRFQPSRIDRFSFHSLPTGRLAHREERKNM